MIPQTQISHNHPNKIVFALYATQMTGPAALSMFATHVEKEPMIYAWTHQSTALRIIMTHGTANPVIASQVFG